MRAVRRERSNQGGRRQSHRWYDAGRSETTRAAAPRRQIPGLGRTRIRSQGRPGDGGAASLGDVAKAIRSVVIWQVAQLAENEFRLSRMARRKTESPPAGNFLEPAARSDFCVHHPSAL